MKASHIKNMRGGWFIGNFSPACLKTKTFEVAVKKYKKGDSEKRHVHNKAVEVTCILEGLVRMNNRTFRSGDIIALDRGESSDFHALRKTTTVVIKTPSIPGDKHII